MGVIGEQFSRPHGFLGSIAGRFMARNNAVFNRWVVVETLSAGASLPETIVEIGSGPGIGTQALLDGAPASVVTAVDPSEPMQRWLRRRNRSALAKGRLHTVTGDLEDLTGVTAVDLVVAVHVLYFWRDPARQLGAVRSLLRPGGTMALGFQLRHHMPAPARRDFPASGHRLYDTDEEVIAVIEAAGLIPQPIKVLGAPGQPGGRLALAAAP